MYSSQTQDQDPYEIKRNRFSLSPNVGYFPMDKLAAGLRFSYDAEKLDINGNETKQTDLMVAPWLRYYFLPPVQDLNIYADVSYGVGSSKFDDDEAESVNKYGVEAGLAWFCNPRVALEFGVGYRSIKYENEENRANTIFFGVGFQIHLQRCGPETEFKVSQPAGSSRTNY